MKLSNNKIKQLKKIIMNKISLRIINNPTNSKIQIQKTKKRTKLKKNNKKKTNKLFNKLIRLIK